MFAKDCFEGKRVLVTGSGRGIGRRIALDFARAGASVMGVSRSPAPLEYVQQVLDAISEGHFTIAADLTTGSGVTRMLEGLEKWGLPDIVVANAHARVPEIPVWKLEQGHRETDIALNNGYLFELFSRLLPHQKQNGFGRWIALSSYAHMVGIRGKAIYNAQKAALEAMFRTLANEQAAYGITANCVQPGYIDTPETRSHPEHIRLHLSAANPMGRAGTVGEIAATVLFLASPAASFITGESLAVTGGGHLAGSITRPTPIEAINAKAHPVQETTKAL